MQTESRQQISIPVNEPTGDAVTTPITREALIDKLADDYEDQDGGGNWDDMKHGRIGLVECSNDYIEQLAEDWVLCDDEGNEAHYHITDADTSKPSAEAINKELLNALIDAQESLGYLAPETFDDAIHEAKWTARMTEIQRVIVLAKGGK